MMRANLSRHAATIDRGRLSSNTNFRWVASSTSWGDNRQIHESRHRRRTFHQSTTIQPSPPCLSADTRHRSTWRHQTRNVSSPSFRTFSESAFLRSEADGYDGVSILDSVDILKDIPLADVRNFCIIAHVDHGKSSIASRLLEYAGNLGSEKQKHARQVGTADADNDGADEPQTPVTTLKGDKEEIELLDTLKVEQERGITVKASAASMLHRHPSAVGPRGLILLNMVDTPGHADFGREVSKTLSAVEGAVLLFDAAQGVQAQTLSVHEKAKRSGSGSGGVKILPALTKIDLPSARPLDVALAVSDLFGFDPDEVLNTSARSRIGIEELIDRVCEVVPSPAEFSDDDGTLRAKVIDSWFEPRRGVVCLVRLLSGTISENDRIAIVEPSSEDESTGHKIGKDQYSIQEIGLVLPKRLRTGSLSRGQMGYVVAGLRDPREARPGSVLSLHSDAAKIGDMLMPKLKTSKIEQSVLYASVHPMEGEGFDELQAAIDRLALNDTGLEIHRTSGSSNSGGGPFLGPGLRVGFQGLLHVEVFRQRLFDEFDLEAIVTPPKVPYLVKYLESKTHHRADDLPNEEVIEDLAKWPKQGQRFNVFEPICDVKILAPFEYAGNVMELIKRKRGTKMETKPIDENTWMFSATMPWADVVTDFHDELKNTSAGYASFDVLEADPPMQAADLCKVEIVLNAEVVDPLSFVCHKDVAQGQSRVVCKKLQEVLPRMQFVTVIQAKADGKIVASERIQPYRKDVLTTGGSKAVGGGDITRKKKLLEKQKKGKKRQQTTGRVTLSQAAFNSVITRS